MNVPLEEAREDPGAEDMELLAQEAEDRVEELPLNEEEDKLTSVS